MSFFTIFSKMCGICIAAQALLALQGRDWFVECNLRRICAHRLGVYLPFSQASLCADEGRTSGGGRPRPGHLLVPRHPPKEEKAAAATGWSPSHALDILMVISYAFLPLGSAHI